MKVRFSLRSNLDLKAVYAFHAERNPDHAHRLTDGIITAALGLATFPDRGSPQPNAQGRPLRRLIENGHLVVYAVTNDSVVILRVAHGARDVDALLADVF